MSFADVAGVVAPQFACSIIMAICVWIVGQSVELNSSWLTLAVQVVWGIFVYASLVYFFRIAAYRDICQLIGERWFRNGKTAPASSSVM